MTGSFVYGNGTIAKVPSTAREGLESPLMGLWQKNKFRQFVNFVNEYDEKVPATYKGVNLNQTKTKDVFDKFGLDVNTQQFIGHAIALHLNDSYLEQPFRETFEGMKLYAYSVARYGNSPYIYPIYGLGGTA